MDRARGPGLTLTAAGDAGPPTSRRERRAREAARAEAGLGTEPAPSPVRSACRVPPPPPQTVLAVCTGNICRSAFAEHALRDRLGALAPGRTETASVGTRPNLELRVPPALVAEAEAVGVHGLREHRPERMSAAAIAAADLILCATEEHMRQVLREVPRVIGVTFTVMELATLIERMDARTGGDWFPAGGGIRAFARQASRHRVLARSGDVSLDIADPFRGPDEGYGEMVRRMAPALETIALALTRAVWPA